MKMKKLPLLLAVLVSSAGLVAQSQSAQQSTQQSGQQTTPPPAESQGPKADAKPDAKTPPSIAGKWVMTVDTQQGPMTNSVDFKVDGKKVTGTIQSEMGTAAIDGEFAEGKLTFAISMDTPNGAMNVDFSATLQADGTLAGTLAGNQGAFELSWRAERAKDKGN